ncbi:MAG: LacI family DNA-binding transcriptional regulator [Actinobacteria bacterium]|nr:LacI family DNA-binding transcriptional regulator [Actinomycetota bacterium]
MKKSFKKPSIKDIARESGVAISTVSHVINRTKFVSEKNTKAVQKAINKLGYRPNILARGLRTKSMRTIGVILPDISQPYFAQVLRGIEAVARSRNYTLILGCTFYDIYEEERQMNTMIDQAIDGLLFFCGYDSYKHIKKAHKSNIPVVVLDRELEDKEIPSVLIDNTLAMKKAFQYLYDLGHRKIGFITFPFDNQTTIRRRYEGYCQGLKDNGLDYDPDIVVIDDLLRLDELKGTYKLIKIKTEQKKIATAYLNLADFLAIGAMHAFKEVGYSVPGDVSLMGFNNEIICEFSDPPLTTVKQPKKIMGATAADLILDMVEGKKIENKNIILETEIIVRGSTASPKT